MVAKSQNGNLHKAKTSKNDEFYTQLSDIENEMKHYKEHFRGKVIYCNCDDPTRSNFYTYFKLNFEHLGLKKLITTHFEKDEGAKSYKLELLQYGKEPIKTELVGNGDFRSEECINLLKESDIVITNPPFSLFREYISQLMEYKKKFLVIGSMNAITYKEIFKFIKDNNLWLGISLPKLFKEPNGNMKQFGNINWFTNLEHKKRNEEIILYKTYKDNEKDYPKYDNYNAIEVSKVKEIPLDYDGLMGVPISFLDKYNPNQFEIVKFRKGDDEKDLIINGKSPYFRIIIKRVKKANKGLNIVGAKRFDNGVRHSEDYYATDPRAISDLAKFVDIKGIVWENACGEGNLSKEIKKLPYVEKVISTDLIDRGYGGQSDFLNDKYVNCFAHWIITNPPYKYGQKWIEKSMSLVNNGAFLMKIQFLETPKRAVMFKKIGLKKVLVYSKRLGVYKDNIKTKNPGLVTYAWYIFEKGYKGNPEIDWITN